MSGIINLIFVAAVMFCVLGGITLFAHIYNLNNIKSKTVGDGQHGTARWATKSEINKTYRHILFTPEKWRKQAMNNQAPTYTRIIKKNLLKRNADKALEEPLPQGIVVGCTSGRHSTTAMVDTGDVHVLMIGAAGVGKTAYWLYPCKYAEKKEIIDGIVQKYHPNWLQKQETNDGGSNGTESQEENYVREQSPEDKKKSGTRINSKPPSRRSKENKPSQNEVNRNGQT